LFCCMFPVAHLKMKCPGTTCCLTTMPGHRVRRSNLIVPPSNRL
jgi:hypothetical protein